MHCVKQHPLGPESAAAGQRCLVRQYDVADRKFGHAGANIDHDAGTLNTHRGRRTQSYVPIGAGQQRVPRTHAGGLNRDHDLTRPSDRISEVKQLDRTTESVYTASTQLDPPPID
jgi:hypothetical protein